MPLHREANVQKPSRTILQAGWTESARLNEVLNGRPVNHEVLNERSVNKGLVQWSNQNPYLLRFSLNMKMHDGDISYCCTVQYCEIEYMRKRAFALSICAFQWSYVESADMTFTLKPQNRWRLQLWCSFIELSEFKLCL